MKKIFLSSLFILFSFFTMTQTVFGLEQFPKFHIDSSKESVAYGEDLTLTVTLYDDLSCVCAGDNCNPNQSLCQTITESCTSSNGTWPFLNESCPFCTVQGRSNLTTKPEFPLYNNKLVWGPDGPNGDMSYTIGNVKNPLHEQITCTTYPGSNDSTTHSIDIPLTPTVSIYDVATGLDNATIVQGGTVGLKINITNVPNIPASCTYTPTPGGTAVPIPENGFEFYTSSSLSVGSYNYNATCTVNGVTTTVPVPDSFNLTVTQPITPPDLPDLVASVPSKSGANSYRTIVTNIGTITSGATPFNVLFQKATHFDDSGTPMGLVSTSITTPETLNNVLSGGTDQRNISATLSLTSSDRFIRACVDKSSVSSLGVISESNENNNCSDWLQIVNLPNLTASSVSVNPISPIAGTPVSITSTISNTGNSATGSSNFHVLFQRSTTDPNQNTGNPSAYNNYKKRNFISSLFYSIANAAGGGGSTQTIFDITPAYIMSPLGIGASASATVNYVFQNNGINWVRACADKESSISTGVILESNETNNCSPWTMVVIGGSSVNGDCGSTPVHYQCAVGTSSAPFISNPTNWTWNCAGANGGTTVNCTETMQGTLTASSNSCLIDKDRSTCNVDLSWNVTSPTGSISAVTTNYPSANTIVGQGHSGTKTGQSVKYDSQNFYLYNSSTVSPFKLKEITITSSCDSSKNLTWNGTKCDCPSGATWNGTVCAVVPMPDLVAGVVSPTVVPKGSSVSYNSTIKNQGTSSTGAGFWNVFQITDGAGTFQYLSPTVKISSALLPGESRYVSVKHKFETTDKVYMRACADKQNATSTGDISESNENNNCGAWKEITVVDDPINGECGTNIYSCDRGTSTSNKDTGEKWTWKCVGSNGGSSISCQSATCPNGANNPTQCTLGDFCENGATNPPICDSCDDGSSPPCATAHCFNGVKDADETGKDCGGTNCVSCTKVPKYIER